MWVRVNASALYSRAQPWRPAGEHLVEHAEEPQHADAARAAKEVGGKGWTWEVGAIDDQGSPAGRAEQGRQCRPSDPCSRDDDIDLPRRGHAAFNLMLMYVLAGYDSDEAYTSRQPAWEPAERYEDVDSAVFAGQRWLRDQPLGQAEVAFVRWRRAGPQR